MRKDSFFSSLKIPAVAALLALSPMTARAQEVSEYKLGFLMPLTGGAGKLGQMMLEGAALAVDEINGAGGINGKRVTLVPEDSQGLAKNGMDGFRKLVDIDGARVIITGWTAAVVAVAPLATESKTFLLSASTASPAVRSISPYFQSTWMYDDETVRQILPYARDKLGVKRLAVMTIINDLGAGLSAAIKKEWERLGGALAVEETHQVQETNFRPSLLKVIAANPDAIYLTSSTGKQSAQIVRQARDLGYTGYFLSYGAFEDPEVLAVGSKAEKSYYTTPAYDPTQANEHTRAFVNAFKRRNNRVPNVHQANHYDLLYLFKGVAEAMQKQGRPFTGENFRATFVATYPEYRGAGGNYQFDFKDGSTLRSTIVKTVKDGAFVKIAELH